MEMGFTEVGCEDWGGGGGGGEGGGGGGGGQIRMTSGGAGKLTVPWKAQRIQTCQREKTYG